MKLLINISVGLLYFLYHLMHNNLIFYSVSLNIFTFMIIAIDKLKSINHFYRIREIDMFLLFGFGGWIGGLLSMLLFRHKIYKISFLANSTISLITNILVGYVLHYLLHVF